MEIITSAYFLGDHRRVIIEDGRFDGCDIDFQYRHPGRKGGSSMNPSADPEINVRTRLLSSGGPVWNDGRMRLWRFRLTFGLQFSTGLRQG